MRPRSRRAVRTAVSLLALTVAGPGAAQSITSAQGLGYPIPPADARTDALGGVGAALQGLAPSLDNPASVARVQARGAVVSVAALEQTATLGDVAEDYGATRFPLVQLLFPVRGVVLTAGYGAYLDQSWAVAREVTEVTGGKTLSYSDLVRSTGGIGEFQLGAAVPLGADLAVGAALGAHTGRQRLRHQRVFESSELGSLEPFVVQRTVRYSGLMAQAGAVWDPLDVLRLGASVKWSGSLQADSVDGPASSREYDLPLQVAGGVSAYLSPSVLASVSGRWSGWSAAGPVGGGAAGIVTSTGRDTWEAGAGLEWDDPGRRATRSFPVRLGVQYRQLPFTFVHEAPTEWWAGGGLGMRVGADPETPRIRLDLTVQRGERSTPTDLGDLTESAWRFALSLAIFGN